MKQPSLVFLTSAFLACAALSSGSALADSKPGVTRTGEVYLFRGLANVFSTGMDAIGRDLRGRGVDARVSNHTTWQIHAMDLVRRSKQPGGISYPVIIMGHSFGADCSIKMANYLAGKGIKVAYVATFDPTHSASVSRNVTSVQNFYVAGKDGPGSYRYVRKAPGFQGKLENRNLGTRPEFSSLHHFNIEKDARIHQQVVSKTYSLTSRRRA